MSLGLDDGDDVNGQRGGLMVLACRVFEEPDQVFIQPGRSSNGDEVVVAMGPLCIMSSAHSPPPHATIAPLLYELPRGGYTMFPLTERVGTNIRTYI